ncbi:hypothetical protein [Campylobacter sp. MIT 97-5078]|uniref:hypothetical protein n=1 Tax=Campylobacter sp. MIT 97-5078 TaxID=1548153 RepID=UPI0009DEA030|nr:hypothetical protein [Campylobacter sp. MIT 97-5078]
MKLFGTDGVRGKAGEFLDSFLAMRLAMAAGIYFKDKAITNNILVGKDTRRSGYMIENAIVSGLTSIGYNVIQIGPMPTPAIAFLTEDMRCDAGIMISASHNPYYDNGIKFFDTHGNKLSEEAERQIEKIYFDDKLIQNAKNQNAFIGQSKRIDDVIGRYIVSIKNSFPKNLTLKNLRVVLDVANGAAYKVAPTIFKELGAEVIVLSDKPNGLNINENCGALHPANLALEVKKLRADVGFAFDGDADRMVALSRTHIFCGDELCYLFAKNIPNPRVLGEVKCSKNLFDEVGKFGEIFMGKTGHSNIKKMMKEQNIDLAAEVSGHIFFKHRYFGYDDGIYAFLRTLELIHKGFDLEGMITSLPKLYTSDELKIAVSEEEKFVLVDAFKKAVEKGELEGVKGLCEIDGARIDFGYGWALLRASNTSPYLITRFEATSLEQAKDIQSRVLALFEKIKANLA